MIQVISQNIAGSRLGEPILVPGNRRRRLSALVKRSPLTKRHPWYTVAVYKPGQPVGQAVLSPIFGRSRETWRKTLVEPGDTVVVTRWPKGGAAGGGRKSGGQLALALASIALVALAPYAAPAIAGAVTAASFGAGLAGTTFAIQAGMVVAGLALGLAAQRSKANKKEDRLNSIAGGGNLPKPGQRKPLIYGRCSTRPPLSQLDVTRYDGDDMVLLKKLTLGFGKFQVHEIRVGRVPLWREGVGVLPPFNADTGDRPTGGGQGSAQATAAARTRVAIRYETASEILPGDIISSEDVTGIQIPRSNEPLTATAWFEATEPGVRADSFTFDYQWPGGIYRTTEKGEQRPADSNLVFEAQEIDDLGNNIGAPFAFLEDNKLSTKVTKALRRTQEIPSPDSTKRYKFRVKDTAPKTDGYTNDSVWEALRANIKDTRIRPKTTEIDIQIRAGKGLSITSYSDIWVEATRILPVWDGTQWVEQPTRKAVWAYADLVRNEYGLNAPDKLDLGTIVSYANGLTEDDEFNGQLPEVASFWERASDVLGVLRADPIKIGDTYSFVRDEPKIAARFIFTRRQIASGSASTNYQFTSEDGAGHVVVEYHRDGNPLLADEVEAYVGTPSRTPKRYAFHWISTPEHAIRIARWLAASAAFRAVEREFEVEWAGRLVKPGDLIYSDVWFLDDVKVGGVAGHAGNLLTLDCGLDVPGPAWSHGNIKSRRGREAAILRMRGGGAPNLVEIHQDDLDALELATGKALGEILASETQMHTTIVVGTLQEMQRSYIVRSAVPSDEDHVSIQVVKADDRVWQFLGEDVILPAPIDPGLVDPPMPDISGLSARCEQVGTNMEVLWSVNAGRAVTNVEVSLSYDALNWESIYVGPYLSGRSTMRYDEDGTAYLRARAWKDGLPPSAWLGPVSFTTRPPVIDGALIPNLEDLLTGELEERLDEVEADADAAVAAAQLAASKAESLRQQFSLLEIGANSDDEILAAVGYLLEEVGTAFNRTETRFGIAGQRFSTYIRENDELVAELDTRLIVQTNYTGAEVARLDQAIVSGDAAQASSLALLSAQVNDPSNGLPATRASFLSYQSTSSTQIAATATSLTALTATVNAPGTGLAAAHAAVVTEATVRASADSALSTSLNSLSAQVNHGTTGLPATLARLVTEETTRANADSALSNSITVLSAQVNHSTTGLPATHARVVAEETARANADSAIATTVSQVSARTDYGTATGTFGFYAKAAISGFDVGFGMMSRVTTGSTSYDMGFSGYLRNDGVSLLVFQAAKFLFEAPGVNGGAPFNIFTASGGLVYFNTNVRIAGDLIVDGDLTPLHASSVEDVNYNGASTQNIKTFGVTIRRGKRVRIHGEFFVDVGVAASSIGAVQLWRNGVGSALRSIPFGSCTTDANTQRYRGVASIDLIEYNLPPGYYEWVLVFAGLPGSGAGPQNTFRGVFMTVEEQNG